MEKPDTITVVMTRAEEVHADKVDLHVTIQGSTLVTGSAALKKAKEVAQLVSALREIGVNEDNISLQSIHAESSGGILGRSTSARYQLRIHCGTLDMLADILDVVTAQKNARLDLLAWRYPDDKQAKGEWLRSCLAEVLEKAGNIAAGLGVKPTGVHDFSEKWFDPDSIERASLGDMRDVAAAKFMAARASSIDLGFPLSHSKKIELRIEVQFRVAGFTAT